MRMFLHLRIFHMTWPTKGAVPDPVHAKLDLILAKLEELLTELVGEDDDSYEDDPDTADDSDEEL